MDAKKLEIMQKIEEKGLTVQEVAKAIEFNPEVLSLYLVKDAYQVPTRILKKISETVLN
jgi:transposase-like protein